ncbi:tRNA uridine-5-carboxymethylaminomethyl(34) synthesis GTPase MnmE [Acidaminobacter sp. JC074]|uniref:tRNA uridine-5-carboxymethylaminomethyl(34) synthesis GTPase MnmE n=1 Tax=Acidaminobacter sp. JC074 TaxID=2530199 RepID=UPI001F0EF2C2|nr:tRNA uridine-5-carboxymethylaminomethyl(34) synthesis GTPase MnmE [Acidaminobacter sp. JC074]MCH4891235.1 tRNA uridine-5-carboxymethylaminomethyl(34) synthesis GTPase MnmE [Acidaminobacter sp. JC074]
MLNETIVAISSAIGEGAIGIIRMSGDESLDILKKMFSPNASFENRKMYYGEIKKDDQVLDEVMAVYMKGPKTYTKEDIVEIYCHGGIISIKRVLDYILELGVRMAEPGEFTQRAFLNGRLDLSQAEAVMDLISAKTEKGFDLAYNQLEGSLSHKIGNVRQKLLKVVGHLEVCIDYPEEDIEDMTYDEIEKSFSEVKDELTLLLDHSDNGRIIREGIKIAIIGKPNVGKSSLLNALLREARAIVTDVAGTTRDIIEEHLNIQGIPIRIIDTAGIRDTEDQVEKIGVERSKEIFNEADMILFVLNANEKLSDEDRQLIDLVSDKKSIIIINKMDLETKIEWEHIEETFSNHSIIKTSLLKDEGIMNVEKAIVDMVYDGDISSSNDQLLSNSRHIQAVKAARTSIENALNATKDRMPYDFIEVDTLDCLESLGKVTGETVESDIVKQIFGQFCLGK